MRRFRAALACLPLSAALLFVPGAHGAGAPVEWDKQEIAGAVTWSGEILLRRPVTVAAGGSLRVAPGTTVRVEPGRGVAIAVLGRLAVEGTPREPARFLPAAEGASREAWEGIRLLGSGGEQGHLLASFRIEGARTGVALAEGRARLVRGVFANCGTGLRGEQKSAAAVDDCLFDGNEAGAVVALGGTAAFSGCRFENLGAVGIGVEKGGTVSVRGCSFARGKAGLFALTDGPCRVEESTFSSLERGIAARQAGENSFVRRCAFRKNGTGILAVQFCAMEIADSVFEGNKTAIEVQEFSAPAIRHNRFESNEAAVSLTRKSHAVIEKNVFFHNRNAVVVNYSSYPRIAGNNFDRNDMSVRLEKFQSGDWEQREGSARTTAAQTRARGSRHAGAEAEAGTVFPRRILARGNYWGPDAARDPQAGTLGKIWDGRKFGPVRYEGFGEKEYAIDVVDFAEEARVPFPDAGPRPANRAPEAAR